MTEYRREAAAWWRAMAQRFREEALRYHGTERGHFANLHAGWCEGIARAWEQRQAQAKQLEMLP